MSNSKSVCLLCRHIAAAKGAARNLQWQPQISQFSTKAPKADDVVNLAMGIDLPKSDPAEYGKRPEDPRNALLSFRRTTPISFPSDRLHLYSSKRETSEKLRKKREKSSSQRADDLFRQIVREQQAVAEGEKPQDTNRSKNNAEKEAIFHVMKTLGEAEQMLIKGEPASEIYDYYLTNIHPTIMNLNMYSIPQACAQVLERLTNTVIKAKMDAMRSPKFPPASVMLLNSIKVTGTQPRKWNRLVGALVQEIVKLDTSEETPDSSVVDDGLYTKDAMLDDLVECWKILSLPRTALANETDDEVLKGFWFPRLDKYSLKQLAHKGNFPAAFSRAFPHIDATSLGAPTTVLAIATYALLVDPRRTNRDLKLRATRLVSRIAYLIAYVPYREPDLRRDTKGHFPGLLDYIDTQWPKITKNLKDRIDDINDSNTETTPEIASLPATPDGSLGLAGSAEPVDPAAFTDDINERSLTYHLQLAISTQKRAEVDRRWAAFIQAKRRDLITPERMEVLRKHPDMFDLFIHTRMALDQPDKAVEVFNALRIAGIKPTLKTWNAMLDGCKKAHNLNGVKNVWAKVRASGVKVDTKLWTTRVSGLMACSDHAGAIAALQEMVDEWNQSSKDENSTAVKPTIEPVNAVISGLLGQNQVKEAEELLAWAGKQDIEPDIFTFNPLLRRYIQDERPDDARRVLSTMKERRINADEATFTALIEAAFAQLDPSDHQAGFRTVKSMLEGMEASGLKANMQNYGKIIYHLLQGSDKAKSAVQHILSHLWDKGLELTPHIYTMLIDYYFSMNPPDTAAVEALLERRRILDYDDRDFVLYDRLARRYSEAGMPERALQYYYRLARANVSVRLFTQAHILNALLQKGLDQEARRLVDNARALHNRKHEEGEVEQTGPGDHLFWRMAAAHGL
ncbi:hypothetical protein F5B19DRAFT_461303 [Rostrohypoxylon terebratum]|nr:hypothetical protein F5B19DRAFT_461303 [Rostrohypoxylon terebratum]